MEKFLKIVFFVCCLAFAVLTMIGCVDDFEKEDQGTNNDEKESVVEVEGLILSSVRMSSIIGSPDTKGKAEILKFPRCTKIYR